LPLVINLLLNLSHFTLRRNSKNQVTWNSIFPPKRELEAMVREREVTIDKSVRILACSWIMSGDISGPHLSVTTIARWWEHQPECQIRIIRACLGLVLLDVDLARCGRVWRIIVTLFSLRHRDPASSRLRRVLTSSLAKKSFDKLILKSTIFKYRRLNLSNLR
jgi:hypothetical protein